MLYTKRRNAKIINKIMGVLNVQWCKSKKLKIQTKTHENAKAKKAK